MTDQTTTTRRSDVRSKLARTEKLDQAQCTSEYTTKRQFGSIAKGTTLRCTRPVSGHRVHQSAFIQW